MEWVKWICAILTGLATCIPLVVKLIQAVQTAAKERNWQKVVDFVLDRMKEAETKFSTGEERKEWVMTCVKASADTFNYDLNMDDVDFMIDAFVRLTKVVNNTSADNAERDEAASEKAASEKAASEKAAA